MFTKLLNLLGISKAATPEPTPQIGLLQKPNPTRNDIKAILTTVGKLKGVDPAILIAIANMESGLNPSIKANTSTAIGLFQFIDSTWNNLVKKYGAALEINSDMRTDPAASAFMMCELINENRRYLAGKGLKTLSNTDLYLCHFLGPNKALQFIAQQRINGSILGVTMLPKEAKANLHIFYDKDEPRTLTEIHTLLGERLTKYL